MNPTVHGMFGVLIALLLPVEAPSELLVIVGFCGGILPDLDSLVGKHRKTFHFPWLYSVTGVFLVFQNSETLVLTGIFLISAGLHSVMDVLAGGEYRSWRKENRSDKGVYDHIRKKWIKPLRLIYGPSIRELALVSGISVLLVATHPSPLVTILAAISVTTTLTYAVLFRYIDILPEEYNEINLFIREKTPLLRERER